MHTLNPGSHAICRNPALNRHLAHRAAGRKGKKPRTRFDSLLPCPVHCSVRRRCRCKEMHATESRKDHPSQALTDCHYGPTVSIKNGVSLCFEWAAVPRKAKFSVRKRLVPRWDHFTHTPLLGPSGFYCTSSHTPALSAAQLPTSTSYFTFKQQSVACPVYTQHITPNSIPGLSTCCKCLSVNFAYVLVVPCTNSIEYHFSVPKQFP